MTKEINADYIYIFSENDANRPGSEQSWSTKSRSTTLFVAHNAGIDLGGESGGTSPSPDLLQTQTIRQSNYDDAVRYSKSATSSIINPIARSANIQLEEVHIHKGSSPITSPRLSATRPKNYNGPADSSKEEGIRGDKSANILKFEKNEFGVISRDPKLNSDPKKLYDFFVSNNNKPEMVIKIQGKYSKISELKLIIKKRY